MTCVLGDNGAGKSTFIKILAGAHEHSDGELRRSTGRSATLSSPRAALAVGIATVYQDLAVVPLMPVWRNFFLGSEVTKGWGPLKRLDVDEMKRRPSDELAAMGIDLRDVDQPIGTLSGGERQCVAIARAVYFGARVLILDEPTAALGVKQSGVVLKYIAKARERGLGVVFITHNPHHAYPVGDRFMLLRRGKSMGDFPKAEMALDELTAMMAGGAELEALSHELSRELGADSERRAEPRGRGQGTAHVNDTPGRRDRLRLDGPGARPRLDAPGVALPRHRRAATSSSPWRTPPATSAGRLGAGLRDRASSTATGESCSPATTSTSCRVCGPNHLHREMGVAVAESGRHLWIEKPAGRDAKETAEIVEAVDAAGVQSAVGFNYRNVPAVEQARELDPEWPARSARRPSTCSSSPTTPRTPRCALVAVPRRAAGSGVLGDLVSHAVDLACHLAGDLAEVVADEGRFIPSRPLAAGPGSHFARGVEGTLGRCRERGLRRVRCCDSRPGRGAR